MMKVLSSVRMPGRSSRILGLIIAASTVAVVASAIVSDDVSFTTVLPVFAILLLAFVAVIALRVEISTDSAAVRIRLRPFYAKQLPAQSIVSVTQESDTGVAEGYGYRILGKDRRGLLVGGPSIKIETAQKTWVISCEDPAEVSRVLNEAINKFQDR